jgi:hypothetical protein
MALTYRLATLADIPALEALIPLSARHLRHGYYTAAQVEGALGPVFGVDTQLIRDGTYFVAVDSDSAFSSSSSSSPSPTDSTPPSHASARIVGCGGWSQRKTLYGGDRGKTGPDPLRDPATEPAMIRAFFVHPDFARRGIGRRLMELSEAAALAAGFRSIEIVATLPGEPLYATFAYAAVERFAITLPVGTPLTVVRMRKLPMPPPLPQ